MSCDDWWWHCGGTVFWCGEFCGCSKIGAVAERPQIHGRRLSLVHPCVSRGDLGLLGGFTPITIVVGPKLGRI